MFSLLIEEGATKNEMNLLQILDDKYFSKNFQKFLKNFSKIFQTIIAFSFPERKIIKIGRR